MTLRNLIKSIPMPKYWTLWDYEDKDWYYMGPIDIIKEEYLKKRVVKIDAIHDKLNVYITKKRPRKL